jgi:hypothetical protein
MQSRSYIFLSQSDQGNQRLSRYEVALIAMQVITHWIDLGIQADKLIAGLPWYGHDYPCINQVNHTVCPIAFAPWRGVKCTDANAPEYAFNGMTRGYYIILDYIAFHCIVLYISWLHLMCIVLYCIVLYCIV